MEFEPVIPASGRRNSPWIARPLGSAFLAFSRLRIQFGTQLYSATVREFEIFVRQLSTKVRIRRTKDGLGVGFMKYESAGCTEFEVRLYV